ncbi:MAG TPA: ion channel [Blastococcus sp.]|nr:ion channel [Blastococcus sp.]
MTGLPADPSGDRFGLVFVLLVSTFVLGALVTDPRGQAAVLLACLAALLLVLRVTSGSPGASSRLRAGLSVISLGAASVVLAAPGDPTAAVLGLWLAVVVAMTIWAIVRRVLAHPAVTMQTVFGGLSAYLLIGFLFTGLYSAVAHLGPGDFFAGGQPANSSTLQYFSFVTMTTTGYGDFTPAGNGARSLAVLEALLGQIFLVTLVARLVAMFGQVRPDRRRPPAAGSGADVPAGDG